MSTSASSSPSRPSFDSVGSNTHASGATDSSSAPMPTLMTFVNNVPPQLIALLIELGPYIARIRWFLEASSWKANSYADSWLLLAAWWAVCLLSEFSVRYLALLLGAGLYVWYSSSTPSVKTRSPATEQSLQGTVIDLSVIESLRPSTLDVRPPILSWTIIARILSFLYFPYLLITHFVRLKFILAVAGTIVFVWRAQWAHTIRLAVWRSAWFRLALFKTWAFISGDKSSVNTLSTESLDQLSQRGQSWRFLFTIYENQRWWVGLDWTAALLPGERPSWCSATHEPLSPPSSFALPGTSCVFVGDGKGGLLKRTASWNWDESEWKVVVKRENGGGTKRIEKEPPSTKEDETLSTSSRRLSKIMNKVQETSQKVKPAHEGDDGDVEEHHSSSLDADEDDCDAQDNEADPHTDPDGWVYGDNQWKSLSSKGGIGKYTRFRKWTRIAVLTEVVEPASAEEVRKHAEMVQQSIIASRETIDIMKLNRQASTSAGSASNNKEGRLLDGNNDGAGDDNDERAGLRQRLKAAIRKSTMAAV